MIFTAPSSSGLTTAMEALFQLTEKTMAYPNTNNTPTAMQRLRVRLNGDASLVVALLSGLLVLLLLLAFVTGGAEVMEGDTHSFDVYLLHGAQSLRASQPWLAAVMREFTALGSTPVITLLVATSVTTGAVFVQFLKTALTWLLLARFLRKDRRG